MSPDREANLVKIPGGYINAGPAASGGVDEISNAAIYAGMRAYNETLGSPMTRYEAIYREMHAVVSAQPAARALSAQPPAPAGDVIDLLKNCRIWHQGDKYRNGEG